MSGRGTLRWLRIVDASPLLRYAHRVEPNLREPTWIAERTVVFVHPDGLQSDRRFAVVLPYIVNDEQARCPLIHEGLETFPPRIADDSVLQVLTTIYVELFVVLAGFVAGGFGIWMLRRESDRSVRRLLSAATLSLLLGIGWAALVIGAHNF